MKKIFIPLILTLMISSCNNSEKKACCESATIPPVPQVDEFSFIHTVYFWLNEGTTEDQKAEFEKGLIRLGEIETIGKYHVGVPANTDRSVIDSSYDYAWIVHFYDGKAQESYQTDSIHLEFIEKYSHLWKKVQVYDTDVKIAY